MLNFDADVKTTTACHQCVNRSMLQGRRCSFSRLTNHFKVRWSCDWFTVGVTWLFSLLQGVGGEGEEGGGVMRKIICEILNFIFFGLDRKRTSTGVGC